MLELRDEDENLSEDRKVKIIKKNWILNHFYFFYLTFRNKKLFIQLKCHKFLLY